jgi:hypothetical protein
VISLSYPDALRFRFSLTSLAKEMLHLFPDLCVEEKNYTQKVLIGFITGIT